MTGCEKRNTCPFFNDKMAHAPATASSFKRKYCDNDYMHCARHMVGVALGKVPATLFPNEIDVARQLIAEGA